MKKRPHSRSSIAIISPALRYKFKTSPQIINICEGKRLIKYTFLIIFIYLYSCSVYGQMDVPSPPFTTVPPSSPIASRTAVWPSLTLTPTFTLIASPEILTKELATVTESNQIANDKKQCINDGSRENNVNGLIYIWDEPNRFYNAYDPFNHEFLSPDSLTPLVTSIPGPFESINASFSQDGDKIAYTIIDEKDQILQFWLSDIDLCNPISYFTDEDEWLSEKSSLEHSGEFIWGPGNKTLIYQSSSKRNHMIVLEVDSKIVHKMDGHCNEILQLKEADPFIIGCQLIDSYALLDWDGTVTLYPEPPDALRQRGVDWSISKKGDSVAYISEDFEIWIQHRDGSSMKLPVVWKTDLENSFYQYAHQNTLHWSDDSKMLLAYGIDATDNNCPNITNILTDELIKQPCWLLFNNTSGQVSWSLTKEMVEDLGLDWNDLVTSFSAALSRDGRFITIQAMSTNGKRNFITYSISSNQVIGIEDFVVFSLVWSYP